MLKKLRFTLLSVILIQACKDNVVGLDEGPSASPQMHLSIGNKWNYSFKSFDKDGKITDSFTFFRRIIGDTVVSGERLYKLNLDSNEASQKVYKLCVEKSDGYYETYSVNSNGSANKDSFVLIYKYPAHINDRYLAMPILNQPIHDTTIIESRSTNISVPAGEFNCYKYVTHINLYGTDSLNNSAVFPIGYMNSYVSDKGFIKTEMYAFSSTTRIPYLAGIMELKTYVIN